MKLHEFQTLKEKLDTRLKSLQSPLGQIPANLHDIIKLFPLILVGLIITITLTLRKINSLRIFFCRELKKDRRKSSDNASLHHLVHCWFLPPYKSILPIVVLGICVVAIIGIFYRSVSLVVGESELFVLPGSDEVNSMMQDLFIGFYIFGFLLILVCLWFIGRVINNTYSKK